MEGVNSAGAKTEHWGIHLVMTKRLDITYFNRLVSIRQVSPE